MNVYKLLLLAFLITGRWISADAQENAEAITMGEPYKKVDSWSNTYFKRGDEILSVKRVGDHKIVLQKRDISGLREIVKNEINDFPSKSRIRTIVELSGRYLVFYSKYNKRAKAEQLFVREIDFTTVSFKNEGSVLMEIGGSARKKKWLVSAFYFYASHDQSKLLVQYQLAEDNAEKERVVGFEVYNQDLKSLWSKEVQLPDVKKGYSSWTSMVSASGDVYLAAQVYTGNDRKKEKESELNYHYSLWKFSPASSTKTPINLSLKEGHYARYEDLQEAPSGEIIFSGYSNSGKRHNVVGEIFLFKLDKNGKILDDRLYDIPLSLINQYENATRVKYNKEKEEEGNVEWKDMTLRQVVCNDDGSILIIGEEYARYLARSYNNKTEDYFYYYNDILVAKIEANGYLSWMRKLPKRQVRRGSSGSMSFKYFYADQKHYFLYLDHIDNLEPDINKAPVEYNDKKRGYLMVSMIDDESGKVDKRSVLNIRDVNGIGLHKFHPSRVIVSEGKNFVFEAYKRRKGDIMIRVKLK